MDHWIDEIGEAPIFNDTRTVQKILDNRGKKPDEDRFLDTFHNQPAQDMILVSLGERHLYIYRKALGSGPVEEQPDSPNHRE